MVTRLLAIATVFMFGILLGAGFARNMNPHTAICYDNTEDKTGQLCAIAKIEEGQRVVRNGTYIEIMQRQEVE